MKTLLLPSSEESLSLAADLLRAGELVAFPTETVYGLGADALNAKAVLSIFAAKGRPAALRANRLLLAGAEVEDAVDHAVAAYSSQAKIIESLVEARRERCTKDGRFVEVYIEFDCRPKLDFSPYRTWVEQFVL